MGDSSRILPRSSSFRPNCTRRLLESTHILLSSHRTVLALIWAIGFVLIISWQSAAVDSFWGPPTRPIPRLRRVVFNLTDFGALGDGITVNTRAFERAVSEIRKRGGGQLNVEPGRWLTTPFNLTSHMTLFLAQNAVILGIDDAVGLSLEEICKVVPGGCLAFFPSYKLLDKLCNRWEETGLWSRLNAHKSLFIEEAPRNLLRLS